MSNQVYENDSNRYIVSKKFSGFYLGVDQDNANHTGTETQIILTNASGEINDSPFLLSSGSMLCLKSGVFCFNITITISNATSQGRSLTFSTYARVFNEQYPSPGLIVAKEQMQGTAASNVATLSYASTVSLSPTFYCRAGDEVKLYVQNFGSTGTATDEMTIISGDPTSVTIIQIA